MRPEVVLGIVVLFAICGVSFVVGQHMPKYDAADLDSSMQAQAVCEAVGERLGIYVTIPPWQAMVLTPILDPR